MICNKKIYECIKKEQNKINQYIKRGFFLEHGLNYDFIFFFANFIIFQIICSEPLLLRCFKKVLFYPPKRKNQVLILCEDCR